MTLVSLMKVGLGIQVLVFPLLFDILKHLSCRSNSRHSDFVAPSIFYGYQTACTFDHHVASFQAKIYNFHILCVVPRICLGHLLAYQSIDDKPKNIWYFFVSYMISVYPPHKIHTHNKIYLSDFCNLYGPYCSS